MAQVHKGSGCGALTFVLLARVRTSSLSCPHTPGFLVARICIVGITNMSEALWSELQASLLQGKLAAPINSFFSPSFILPALFSHLFFLHLLFFILFFLLLLFHLLSVYFRGRFDTWRLQASLVNLLAWSLIICDANIHLQPSTKPLTAELVSTAISWDVSDFQLCSDAFSVCFSVRTVDLDIG